MRTFVILLGSAALAACAAGGSEAPMRADADGEAVLAKAIEGRTAGPPVSCVRQRDVRNTRGGGGNTILFDGTGGTVYVNQARGSCPAILPWHAISHRSISTNICTGEVVRIFDPQTGIEFGSCSLGEFVPYRRRS